MLFEWVGGRPLRARMRAERVREVVADRVLYFRVADRLEELRPRYGSALGLDAFVERHAGPVAAWMAG